MTDESSPEKRPQNLGELLRTLIVMLTSSSLSGIAAVEVFGQAPKTQEARLLRNPVLFSHCDERLRTDPEYR